MDNQEINLIAITGNKQMGKDSVARIIRELTTPERVPDENGLIPRSSYSDWRIKSFAKKMKECASLILGIPVEKFEEEETKLSFLSDEWINKTETTEELLTVRDFLQRLGTEVGRSIHPNIWVNALFVDYQTQKEKVQFDDVEEYKTSLPKWVISDLRFLNEIKAVRERGGLIFKVFRPGVLRVWWNDPNENLAENGETSGYYYVQDIDLDVWTITEYSDGEGNKVQVYLSELQFDPADNHQSERELDLLEDLDEIIVNDGTLEDLKLKVQKILKHYKII